MKIVGLAILLTLTVTFALKKELPKRVIYKGQKAVDGQFPFMVSLKCAGNIYNNRWIITAAHCVYRDHVFAGTIFPENGTRYEVDKFIQHPEYKPEKYFEGSPFDIGLVRTSTEIQFNKLVQPIKISRKNVTKGVEGIIAGWGKTETGEFPESLMFLNVTVGESNNCPDLNIHETDMCVTAKTNLEGIAKGDSGGPFILNGELVGVASRAWFWKPSGAVYTRVLPFESWIKETIKNNP